MIIELLPEERVNTAGNLVDIRVIQWDSAFTIDMTAVQNLQKKDLLSPPK